AISRLKSLTASKPLGYTLQMFFIDKLAIIILLVCYGDLTTPVNLLTVYKKYNFKTMLVLTKF
ncbi:MAG: hypothetical protein IK121_09955, partial [Lachnospiraceae bacterium]|nr:hypothetical protein [Lachnospiraceae bacterium]